MSNCECGFVLTGRKEDFEKHWSHCVVHDNAVLRIKVQALLLQNQELQKAAENNVASKRLIDATAKLAADLATANRLNGELWSLLECANRKVPHAEPPHTVEEMHLDKPMQFRNNCLRCRIDKALGDVAIKRNHEGV